MNDAIMRNAFSLLDSNAINFILNEFCLSITSFLALSEDELVDLYERLGDIEIEETPDDNSELTPRGKMVETIITIVGNYFSDRLGCSIIREL